MNKNIRLAVLGIKGIPAQYGGFETCVDETSKRLVTNGVSVLVYCRKSISSKLLDNYNGIKLKYVDGIKTKNLYTISTTFISVIKELFSSNNVIHLYTVGNAIFIPILKLFGKKCVISVDALDWKRKKWGRFASWFIKTSESIAVKFANSVISDSKVICQYYLENHKREIDYVSFGSNIKQNIISGDLTKYNLESKKYFLFVGLFRSEKNVDFLIKAFNNAKTGDYKLALIGDDPMNPEIVRFLHSLKTEKIVFLGRKYNDEYDLISQNAYCYVTASIVEGTSPSLLAAMGFKTAVLVSDIPENIETIGDAGFSFVSNNEVDLIKKIEFLINNNDIVKEYSVKAQERVRIKYSWDKVSSDFLNIYQSIIQ
jgi:glycosyltransferase involved in cell wall biosynthesis